MVRARKGIHRELLDKAQKRGVSRARIDEEWVDLKPSMKLDRYIEHDIELLVAETRSDDRKLSALLSAALTQGSGAAIVYAGKVRMLLSNKRACPECGEGYPELDPRFFSFNTQQGQCSNCEGKGVVEKTKSRGRRKDRQAELVPCAECEETRLSPLARSVYVDGKSIDEIFALSIAETRKALKSLRLNDREKTIAKSPLNEAERRLAFIEEVGLGYLGLGRAADTLSGGEMQRLRLAAQLGSGMTGVLYVLDEPTIGLHPRDTDRLIEALRSLRDRGNSVVVVEHDAEMIMAADHVIDMGPGGGRNGGQILAEGRLKDMKGSVTADALLSTPDVQRKPRSVRDVDRLTLCGANQHNLKNVDVAIPLQRLVVVTGVSGSGKSTLIRDVLLRSTRQALGLVNDRPVGEHRSIEGTAALKRAIEIDQSPIGRTPRSVPATYIGIWDTIRKLLAGTPLARARGYTAARFSFNTEDGRCPDCKGQGANTVEMAFLPNVLVPCDTCRGLRFTPETLQIMWRGKNAGEILDMEVADAVKFFEPVQQVRKPLELLNALGLGYLKLGQPSNTLSGGEAQRLKLVAEMSVADTTGPTLYVMDEPTTGLHRDDVKRLIAMLQSFVDRGDSLVVIEHHTDVMLAADHLIDLGPEGGNEGGKIVAEGTPSQIRKKKSSRTGKVLDEITARAQSNR
ncbi:MAG: ATP-binding cassette domain-containing protein [Polyangiales bacterium]